MKKIKPSGEIKEAKLSEITEADSLDPKRTSGSTDNLILEEKIVARVEAWKTLMGKMKRGERDRAMKPDNNQKSKKGISSQGEKVGPRVTNKYGFCQVKGPNKPTTKAVNYLIGAREIRDKLTANQNQYNLDANLKRTQFAKLSQFELQKLKS